MRNFTVTSKDGKGRGINLPLLTSILVLIAIFGVLPEKGINFRLGKILLTQWGALFIITAAFIKDKWLKLFLFWVIFRMITWNNKQSYFETHAFLVFVLLYQIFANNFKLKYMKPILNGIAVIAILQALVAVLQYYGVWVWIIPVDLVEAGAAKLNNFVYFTQPFTHPVCGTTSNSNMLGSVFALTLPAFFRKKWILASPLILYGLWVSNSFTSILAAVGASAIYIMFILKKRSLYLIPIVIGFGIAYLLTQEHLSHMVGLGGRVGIWKEIFERIYFKKWFAGTGFGQFQILFPLVHRFHSPLGYENWYAAHNDFIQLLVELGVVGFTLAMGYIVGLFKKVWYYRDELIIPFCGIVAVIINANGNFLMHTSIGAIAIVYAMMIEGGYNECERSCDM